MTLAPHDLVAVIGEEATVRLLVRLGGVDIYIPRTPGPESEIANVIGIEAARRLCDRFGPARQRLPKARSWCRRLVLGRVADGNISKRQAALLLDLSERQIHNLMPGRGGNAAADCRSRLVV